MLVPTPDNAQTFRRLLLAAEPPSAPTFVSLDGGAQPEDQLKWSESFGLSPTFVSVDCGARPGDQLKGSESFDLFKFYEDASEKIKTHIWSQTSWILSLSTAILALSVNFYLQHRTVFGFGLIIWIAALAGAVLCIYLFWTLREFGKHIRRNWKHANVLAVRYHHSLIPFVQPKFKDLKEDSKKDFFHLRAVFRWVRDLFSKCAVFLWGGHKPPKDFETWKRDVLDPSYEADFPPFCRRLQLVVLCVLVAHFVWAGLITWLASNQPAPLPPLGGPLYPPGTRFDGSWPF